LTVLSHAAVACDGFLMINRLYYPFYPVLSQ
jgi:hypothetical protein